MLSESQNIEYKESWRDEYLKWICGFANAQGGRIFIGVNDEKQVIGLPDAKKLMEDIPNKIVNYLGIVEDVNLLAEGEKEYIEIVVTPSNVPIAYKGTYHYRSGSTKQELKGLALQQFIMRKMGHSWDDIPVYGATIDDIDRKAIDYFLHCSIKAGRMDEDEADASTEDVLRQSMIFNLVVGLAAAAFGIGISRFLPGWLGADPSLQADASAYFAIWSASLPFLMIMGTYSSMLRSSGDALTPGLISVLTCVLDVIFNFCLINPTREMVVFGRTMTVWGLGWGVPGAALGTALATAISGVLTLAILLLRDGPLCIRKPGSWHITKACLQNLWKVGAPLAAERAVLSSAQVLLIRIVSGLGTTAIAANSLGVSAESLCYMAGYGIQDASLALVGQAVGANRRDMAKNFAWLCTGMGIGIMALTGVGMYIFAPNLMGIFTAYAAVIALGAQVLRIEALAEPMFGASIVASGAMQGAGDSTGCFVLNLVSMWGIRLTLASLLAPHFGLVGVWMAMSFELTMRGVLFLVRLVRGRWLDKGALA